MHYALSYTHQAVLSKPPTQRVMELDADEAHATDVARALKDHEAFHDVTLTAAVPQEVDL